MSSAMAALLILVRLSRAMHRYPVTKTATIIIDRVVISVFFFGYELLV
jgi:hypothetical protein